jgi:hypothetical protein
LNITYLTLLSQGREDAAKLMNSVHPDNKPTIMDLEEGKAAGECDVVCQSTKATIAWKDLKVVSC